MKFKSNKLSTFVSYDGLLCAIYFGMDHDKYYLLHRLFQMKFKFGICTKHHVTYKSIDPYDGTYHYHDCIERKTIGVYFDITILNIQLSIYLHPIIYKIIK